MRLEATNKNVRGGAKFYPPPPPLPGRVKPISHAEIIIAPKRMCVLI